MGTISGHQLSSFTTPVNGTTPIDANQVRGNDNSIRSSYNAHDADATIHLQSGPVASRPSATTLGQTWLATDAGANYVYLDNGSSWVEVSYLRVTGGTLTGGLTVSSGTTAVQALTATTGAFSSFVGLGNVGVGSGTNYLNLPATSAIAANNADKIGFSSSATYIKSPSGGTLELRNGSGAAMLSIANDTSAATFAGNVGFNATSAIAKPTVTGSRGANAALASLLTALANYGLITDSTS